MLFQHCLRPSLLIFLNPVSRQLHIKTSKHRFPSCSGALLGSSSQILQPPRTSPNLPITTVAGSYPDLLHSSFYFYARNLLQACLATSTTPPIHKQYQSSTSLSYPLNALPTTLPLSSHARTSISILSPLPKPLSPFSIFFPSTPKLYFPRTSSPPISSPLSPFLLDVIPRAIPVTFILPHRLFSHPPFLPSRTLSLINPSPHFPQSPPGTPPPTPHSSTRKLPYETTTSQPSPP